ncbi:MAG: glycosyltransferase family 2 protein [Archaeoglobaceae archaeon]
MPKCLKNVNQTLEICRDFDVLIIDGASKDSSKEVVEKFSKLYPCVKFKVQEKLGGTGFARREVCRYALNNGYDVVVWGDSENFYSRDYVEKILIALKDCDVAGGIPVVRGNFFAHAFAWYHAIHLIFGIWRWHIPGNNRAEKVKIYEFCEYPESRRAEDYGFSLLLIKKGIKLRHKVVNARVIVSVPEKIGEIINWQKARVKGCAEALRIVEFRPYDLLAWSSILPLFLISIFLLPFSSIALLFPIFLTLFSLFLYIKSSRFIEKPRKIFFFAPLIGILIHSAFSILGLYHYFITPKKGLRNSHF